jgi:putative membrane protein
MTRQIRVLHVPRILKEPAVRYKAVSAALITVVSIFGIPLLPLIYPLTRWHQKKFYDRLEVILTRRDLVVRMGVWNRQEKSIPLEKITDVALLEGPIMRAYGVKGLRVETAGQVSGALGLVNLVGIDDPDGFRDRILEQRDRISDGDAEVDPRLPAAGAPPEGEGSGTMAAAPGAAAAHGAASAAVARGGGFGAGSGSADPEVLALLREIRDQLARLERR